MGLFDRNPSTGALVSPIGPTTGGGGGGSALTVQDEGSTLSAAVTSINFVGAGVTATGAASITVTIPGGGGGITWATPVDSSITFDTTNTYDIGTPSVKANQLFTKYADLTLSGSLVTSYWGTDLPGLVIDGTTTEAQAAFGAGIFFKGHNSISTMVIATEERSDTNPSSGIYIFSGKQLGASGNTGEIAIETGQSGNGNSGSLTLLTGAAPNGTGGAIYVSAGGTGANRGNLSLQGGQVSLTSENGGVFEFVGIPDIILTSQLFVPRNMIVRTSDYGSNASDTGTVSLITGDLTNAISTNDTGSVVLRTGVTAGSGLRGTINFNERSLPTASNGHVWTLQDQTTGRGAWVAPSGGGITWATPIDANITLDTNNLYTIGTDSVRFKNIQTNGLYATDGGTITTTGIGCLVSGRIRSGFTWALSADGTRALVGSSTNGGGTITYNISGIGSTVMGSISGNGTFTKNISGQGCLVSGFSGNGSLTLNSTSHVLGYWDGPTISVGAANNGSTIIGASLSGTMSISGVGLNGNTLIGFTNSGTLQTTAGQGALVRGYALSSGSITGSNDGVFASGYVTGSGSTITASGPGSHAMGMTSAGGDILSSSSGSMAFGFAQGTLTASGAGSLAFGVPAAGGTIQATQQGAFAGGSAFTSGSSINAQTNAGIAFGFVNSTFAITTSGGASLALGRTSTGSILATGLGSISMGDELSTSGEWAISFGRGHVNNTFLTAVFGRYSVTPTANASTWTATDPLFVVGNGADSANRANAFTLLKDGSAIFSNVIRSANLAADPGAPANGDIWYNTTSNQLKAYVNGATVVLA